MLAHDRANLQCKLSCVMTAYGQLSSKSPELTATEKAPMCKHALEFHSIPCKLEHVHACDRALHWFLGTSLVKSDYNHHLGILYKPGNLVWQVPTEEPPLLDCGDETTARESVSKLWSDFYITAWGWQLGGSFAASPDEWISSQALTLFLSSRWEAGKSTTSETSPRRSQCKPFSWSLARCY